MKPNPVGESFGSIEQHIRRAQEQRAAFLAGLLSNLVVAAGRMFAGTTARVTRATQTTARSPEPAAR
ncbi:MAG TPA: hypothetical protein VFJ62_21565 [Usitatibacter sp.]|nr:hypothetical protein [Usitatibacter sp.]